MSKLFLVTTTDGQDHMVPPTEIQQFFNTHQVAKRTPTQADLNKQLIDTWGQAWPKGSYGIENIQTWHEHLDKIKRLITAGADVNTRVRFQGSSEYPLLSAAINRSDTGFLGMREFTAEVKEYWTKLNTDLAHFCLDHGARVNIFSDKKHGFTPLMVTAIRDNVPLMRRIIQMGADVDAQNDRGTTALCLAAINHHADCCRLLAEHGADIHKRDTEDGKTVIEYVCSNPFPDVKGKHTIEDTVRAMWRGARNRAIRLSDCGLVRAVLGIVCDFDDVIF